MIKYPYKKRHKESDMPFLTYSYTTYDLKKMPPRRQDSHKGDYGRLLCVCGSVGMCGAAILAARAAYRTGAGLVRILTVKENLVPIQAAIPEAIVSVYDEDFSSGAVLEAVEWADAIVIGCGLGRSPLSRRVLGAVLRASRVPTLIDADGLNIISQNPALKKYLSGTIVTPHLLEMSRLCGISTEDISTSREETAQKFASATGAVCLLKGYNTCIADGGDRVYINKSGNCGMATAGSGDVLAGIIGGILAQNKTGALSLTEAAALGAYLHGAAGDIAAQALGEYSLMASDIIDAIPKVLKNRC